MDLGCGNGALTRDLAEKAKYILAIDFNKKNMLTEQQEERLEGLYKEKSRLIPNRNYFSPKESSNTGKTKVSRFSPKFMH